MKANETPQRTTLRPGLLGLSMLMLIAAGGASADEAGSAAALDEERMVQRLKEEIMKEFRDGDFLKEQIQIGIGEYIREQQELRARAQEQEQGRLAKNIRPVSADRDHIQGNPEAEITLVEYSDFECPFCKRFHPTAQKLVETFDGKVNWVYRHFPLNFHNPGAQTQAEASECANELDGNDGFWAFTDALYERTRSGGNGFALDQLKPLAVELGLDGDKFQECLDSGRYTERVKEDLEEGTSIGIRGTPGNVLLNNRTGQVLVRAGALPYARLKQDIDQMLADEESAQN